MDVGLHNVAPPHYRPDPSHPWLGLQGPEGPRYPQSHSLNADLAAHRASTPYTGSS